jgi:hypothetical protein
MCLMAESEGEREGGSRVPQSSSRPCHQRPEMSHEAPARKGSAISQYATGWGPSLLHVCFGGWALQTQTIAGSILPSQS